VAVVLLWGLVVVCFWKIALAGRVLAGGDVFTYFYPYWAEATRAIRVGRLPLWNPYLFMGAPFLANSQVGFLYPLNWPLWLLLPAHRSVHLTIVLHLCLAALNAYAWGRTSLRLGRVGAWTVGLVFALGGYMGAQVEHINQLQGLAWLPLLLLLWDRSVASGGEPECRAGALGLAVVVSLVLLAGHTQTAFISLVGLAAYGMGSPLVRSLRWRKWGSLLCEGKRVLGDQSVHRLPGSLARRAGLLAASVTLGAAVAAVQLLPTWELARLSVRAQGLPFLERVSFSLSPGYLARALLPGLVESVPPEHIEHVAYVGISGLALALVALLSPRFLARDPQRPTANLHPPAPHLQSSLLLLALGLFFSLGLYNPLYLLLARFVPGFAHFRVPARWLALYAVGMAALAGWGADALWYRPECVAWHVPPHRKGRAVPCLFAFFVLALVGWALVGVHVGERARVGWPTIAGWAVGAGLTVGLLAVGARAPRLATVGLLALLVVELFAAGSTLPYSRATAPQAFVSLRPAIAHLLASSSPSRPHAPSPDYGSEDGPGDGDAGVPSRFLSMSDITFDPGDLADINLIYGPQLSPDELYDHVVAAKHKEVLSPNLMLAFGVPAVDGYDGGVLPLARYVALQRLFLDDVVSMDGRLRENLTVVPDGRWLSLFNVRHIITDKLRDAWLDDVFYDLQFGARLVHGETALVHVPPLIHSDSLVCEGKRSGSLTYKGKRSGSFEATALGVVSYLHEGAGVPQGTLVGVVEIGFGEEFTRTFGLRAGEHTAEGVYGPDVAHAQATVGGHFWPGRPEGNDYVTRLRWDEPAAPTAVVVRAVLPKGELVVRGVSLIDERTGGFQALVLSDRGRFQLVHSGDVKVYQNVDVLPRAFVVYRSAVAADDEQVLDLMRDPAFDPAAEVILSPVEGQGEVTGMTLAGVPTTGSVRSEPLHISYAPERVEVEVVARSPGYLLLTDAWYPGWEATVDGEPVPVRRADLLFRAVRLDAGRHQVVFVFRPASLRIGAVVTMAGFVSLVVGFAWGLALSKARRSVIMDVVSGVRSRTNAKMP
jgi:hypothetical protein